MLISSHNSKAEAKSAAAKVRKTRKSVIFFNNPKTGKWEVRAGDKK